MWIYVTSLLPNKSIDHTLSESCPINYWWTKPCMTLSAAWL